MVTKTNALQKVFQNQTKYGHKRDTPKQISTLEIDILRQTFPAICFKISGFTVPHLKFPGCMYKNISDF